MITEDELSAYLAEYSDRAHLRLRGASNGKAAYEAMRNAARAVLAIPHPESPEDPLPNWCQVVIDSGEPVLHLDMQNYSDYAGQVARAILGALLAAGVDGRLEPENKPAPPFSYDAAADVADGADYLWDLDHRRLPSDFPEGFPIPPDALLVNAQEARDGTWSHAAWCKHSPFDEYVARLREFGWDLQPAPPPKPIIGSPDTVFYAAGPVSVWTHCRKERWYLGVLLMRAGPEGGV